MYPGGADWLVELDVCEVVEDCWLVELCCVDCPEAFSVTVTVCRSVTVWVDSTADC